jgi:hypothetical protein
MSAEFWNERYSVSELVYGEAPNEFLASMADRLPASGHALDIGAGEGRNALFLLPAAWMCWPSIKVNSACKKRGGSPKNAA